MGSPARGETGDLADLGDGKTTLFLLLTAMITLVASYITTEHGQHMVISGHFTPIQVFAFAILAAFVSSRFALSLLPDNPAAARLLEQTTMLSIGVALASLVAVLLPPKLRWVAYSSSSTASLPLLQIICWWLAGRVYSAYLLVRQLFYGGDRGGEAAQVQEDVDDLV